ncbi:YeiH family protein [Peteryoungia desertarenae]|nr:putative sulfate exporter family transporter [Peteryoungia desertarenae]
MSSDHPVAPDAVPEQASAMSPAYWKLRFPGLAIAALIALASAFLSEHYGAPAMLLAILIGLALHFLAEDPRTLIGLEFAARVLLRLGIALLGLRISFDMFADLGFSVLAVLVGAVVLTITFGMVAARMAGQKTQFGVLTGGAVAICGASAAMAIAAVLPRRNKEEAERDMVFAVFGVTMLSTLAMILYPVIAAALGLNEAVTGLFLGATIHDVAQVVGAGFSVSEPTGEMAVLVKLIRVTLLAPVVLVIALAYRRSLPSGTKRPPIIPLFVVVFLALAALNSSVNLPDVVTEFAGGVSRWALLAAIAAVGVKTSLPKVMQVGRRAIGLLVAETLFLAALILIAVEVLPLDRLH